MALWLQDAAKERKIGLKPSTTHNERSEEWNLVSSHTTTVPHKMLTTCLIFMEQHTGPEIAFDTFLKRSKYQIGIYWKTLYCAQAHLSESSRNETNV